MCKLVLITHFIFYCVSCYQIYINDRKLLVKPLRFLHSTCRFEAFRRVRAALLARENPKAFSPTSYCFPARLSFSILFKSEQSDEKLESRNNERTTGASNHVGRCVGGRPTRSRAKRSNGTAIRTKCG